MPIQVRVLPLLGAAYTRTKGHFHHNNCGAAFSQSNAADPGSHRDRAPARLTWHCLKLLCKSGSDLTFNFSGQSAVPQLTGPELLKATTGLCARERDGKTMTRNKRGELASWPEYMRPVHSRRLQRSKREST